jgi:uncharacterized membrane protein
MGVGIKLKERYPHYSAVLVSGAIAILYFDTYAAYSFYDLIPQAIAFVMMFIFTCFAVVAAISYNKQIIAHIGLVGAYAVPFLLSNGSDRPQVLFSYMTIINIGILVTAFKKYWKPLYWVSFMLTWAIFLFWLPSRYSEHPHFGLSLFFLTIFFATFYGVFLAYKLNQNEKFSKQDVVLILVNSFIFYATGYTILEGNKIGVQLLGVFTLLNALIHFGVSSLLFKRESIDKNLFYLIVGLVLLFITITVPVQLDGHWVTLIWALEAAILFWIGRTKAVGMYEKMSYPVMIVALFSLLQDWGIGYNDYFDSFQKMLRFSPIINVNFLSSVLFTFR